jgi:hypothetical protein
MRYSYLWDVSATDLPRSSSKHPVDKPYEEGRPLLGRYVRIRGALTGRWDKEGWANEICDGGGNLAWVVHWNQLRDTTQKEERVFIGRVSDMQGISLGVRGKWSGVDTTASRFTWQSIAGLTAGLFGLGVFSFALRGWVKARTPAE